MKIKMSATLLATALVSLTLVGCGEQAKKTDVQAPDTAATPTLDQSPTTSSSGVVTGSPFGDPTSCADLVSKGWVAPETDPSINFDPESGVAEVWFTDPADKIVVDVLEDPACSKLPGIGPILARTQSNFEQSMRETCEDLVTTLNAGKVPEREGMTADPDGMRKYVLEECPEQFVKELKSPTS